MPENTKSLEEELAERLRRADEAAARGLERVSEFAIRKVSISMLRINTIPPPIPPTVLEMGFDGVLRVKR